MESAAIVGASALGILFIASVYYYWYFSSNNRPVLGIAVFTVSALAIISALAGESLLIAVFFAVIAGFHLLVLMFRK